MFFNYLIKITCFTIGSDTRYVSHPSSHYITRDNLYGNNLYSESFNDNMNSPVFESRYPYGYISRAVEPHHEGYGPSAYSDLELAGRYAAGDRRYLRDEDMLQRKFTTHGLGNHWLAD
jgi:hypothetical protein